MIVGVILFALAMISALLVTALPASRIRISVVLRDAILLNASRDWPNAIIIETEEGAVICV